MSAGAGADPRNGHGDGGNSQRDTTPPDSVVFDGVAGLRSPEFFTERGLERLCRYKAQCSDMSLTYRYVLRHMYDRAVELLPLWLAPNVVTLLGFIGVLSAHVLLSVSGLLADARGAEIPRWVYVVCCLALFAYMTLDNLDGRQARRTGSSSPLGHLFDHGCDALNVTVTGLTVSAALRLDGSFTLFLLWTFGMSVFFAATLEEFYTGSLILREINGANEGLLVMQSLYAFDAVFGSSVWTRPISVPAFTGVSSPVPLSHVLVSVLALPVSAPTIVANYVAIYQSGRRTSRNTLQKAFVATLPFIYFTVGFFAWPWWSTRLSGVWFAPYCWLCGLIFFYIMCRVITAHLGGAPRLPWRGSVYMSTPLLLGALLAANGLVSLERPLLLGSLLVVTVVNAWDVRRIAVQICSHLGIETFSLRRQTAASERSGGAATQARRRRAAQ